jgi:F0F1-type ATP synthase assembly protein I
MEKKTEKDSKLSASKKKPSEATAKMQVYAKYSSMAIQFGLTITIGAFIGRRLDAYFGIEKPFLTALFSLLATVGGIYLLIRDLLQKK